MGPRPNELINAMCNSRRGLSTRSARLACCGGIGAGAAFCTYEGAFSAVRAIISHSSPDLCCRGCPATDPAREHPRLALLPAAPPAKRSGDRQQHVERATAARVRLACCRHPAHRAACRCRNWPLSSPTLPGRLKAPEPSPSLPRAGPASHCSCSACCSPRFAPQGSTRWPRRAGPPRHRCSPSPTMTSCAAIARLVWN